ncbi:hypothetical protein DCO17_09125 [Polynucleobacter tropicus]|uniref:Methyltransferase type 11 domain-containing protein n=1 Tax=Polynucleobacter tropicus TaxID=1743174 RepID=A0A6M9Q2J5_9BURK|nr:hypothetical protein [Polynucleobacter tropicus]QKM65385.1 hypothetical protein DCO17_09125 [Polynucleobacter tropicus]
MKFNMGCGLNKLHDYVNVDRYSECVPDLQIDLEQFPWPINSSEADEVVFNHCLEHLGQTPDIFLGVMKELYRISKPNARIFVNVPHPRHEHFIGDPTHVRVINPLVLNLFSKKNNLIWKQNNIANTPLALYLDVDFELLETIQVLDPYYQDMFDKKELSIADLNRIALDRNNVIQEYRMILKVIK